jgi:hypothetical protein
MKIESLCYARKEVSRAQIKASLYLQKLEKKSSRRQRIRENERLKKREDFERRMKRIKYSSCDLDSNLDLAVTKRHEKISQTEASSDDDICVCLQTVIVKEALVRQTEIDARRRTTQSDFQNEK